MTDHAYTDDDLRHEAARQHAALTDDPDFMGVGEQLEDAIVQSTDDGTASRKTWHELLVSPTPNDEYEAYGEAQQKIHDLIKGAADVSQWAVGIGADDLEPLGSILSMQTTIGPLARIHFAVRPDMPEHLRNALVEGIALEIAKYLPGAEDNPPTIGSEAAAHVLFQERLGGWPPSTFASKLLNLWTSADTPNAEHLANAFPEYAAAIALLKKGQPGIEQLLAIADGT